MEAGLDYLKDFQRIVLLDAGFENENNDKAALWLYRVRLSLVDSQSSASSDRVSSEYLGRG